MSEQSTLKKLQLMELDMFKEVVRICDKYDLTYFMSAGTFLGAVRHKGFIPWDDDMDMRMPRDDYEKLIKILPVELKSPYIACHYSIDKKYHRYFCRVENTKAQLVRTHTINEQKSNIWMDIFPLDGMPENKIYFNLRKIHLLYRKMMLQLSVFDEIIDVKKKRPWYENVIVYLATNTNIQKHLSLDKMWEKLDNALKSYSCEKSNYYMNFMSAYKFKDIMPKSVYGEGKLYAFEDTKFKGAEDSDTFLKTLYGDYMKLPPEEKRNNHDVDGASIEILE